MNDHLRKVFGPSGQVAPLRSPTECARCGQLGDGWASHVTAEVALGTRDGTSVRGGDLGGLTSGALSDAAAVDAAVDAGVQAVAARRGVTVGLPSAGGSSGGGTVDAAALGEFTEQITGRDGVLASAARLVLDQLGLTEQVSAALEAGDETELVDLVAAELGSDWPRMVAPAFDAKRAVLIDDRWATAREDLARLWIGWDSIGSINVDGFVGAGDAVVAQAHWWQNRAKVEGRSVLAAAYEQIAAAAAQDGAAREPLVPMLPSSTGASKGSIAAAVTGKLLAGGATVVVTTSRLDDERLGFYRDLYRDNARTGAALWVVPANIASYRDVDALIDWIGSAADRAGRRRESRCQTRDDTDTAVPVRRTAGGG